MVVLKMTVEQLLKSTMTVDVVTNYSDDLYIAFVGSQKLTEKGKYVFESILQNRVTIENRFATINCLDESQNSLLQTLFNGSAGYINNKLYHLLFDNSDTK